MRLILLMVLLASPLQSQNTDFSDVEASIDVGRIATCLRRPHGDPHLCIGIAANACQEGPSSAANAVRASERCDLAEQLFWWDLLERNMNHLTRVLRGASLRNFERQQALWEQTGDLCTFPFINFEAPLWPEAEASHCALLRVAERALQLKSYVTDYLDQCEFPASDYNPDFPCQP